jgi:hypothetical protein
MPDDDKRPQAVESIAELPADKINPRHDGDDRKLTEKQKGLKKKGKK